MFINIRVLRLRFTDWKSSLMLNQVSVSLHFSFFAMALFTSNVEDLFTCTGSNFTKLISAAYYICKKLVKKL